MPSRSRNSVSLSLPRITVARALGSSYCDLRRQFANCGFATRSKMISDFLFCAEAVNGAAIVPIAVIRVNIMVPELKQPRWRASQVFVITFSIR